MTDSKNYGWVRLYRKSLDSSVWEKPTIWKVWCWCLLKANHQQTRICFNNSDLLIEKGQFVTGIAVGCSEIGITAQSYRTAIAYLKSTGRITIKATNKFSIISIINWEMYQVDDFNNKQTNKPVTNQQQTSNKPVTTYKNDKNDNNDKNNTSGFETFWKAYPKRKSKKQAEKTWAKLKPDEALLKTILSAIDKAKGSLDWTKDNGQYIPYPSTWLNDKRWEDEVTEKPPPQQGDPDWYPTEEFITEIEQANGIFRDEKGAVINAK